MTFYIRWNVKPYLNPAIYIW